MSTRSVITFRDKYDSHSIYKHSDGYPVGMAESLKATLESGMAWPLPRFEADEFAAAFVAANKKIPGGFRLTKSADEHGDLEYVYEVYLTNGELWITVESLSGFLSMSSRRADKFLFEGPVDEFILNAEAIETGSYA